MLVEQVERLVITPSRWKTWSACEPVLARWDLLTLRRALVASSTSFDERDGLLAALLRIGARDEHARLAVLACLLPGLRRAVRRFGSGLEPDDAWAELIAAMWRLMGSYDLGRRPERIAANLLWDVTGALRKAVRVESTALGLLLRATGDRPVRLEPEPATTVLAPAVEAGVVSVLDASLIEATRLHGMELCHAASLLGLSYEAAKKRRRRAEVEWVSWWSPSLRPTRSSIGVRQRLVA